MAGQRGASRPAVVAFHRTKYGRELLVDAAFLRRLPNFDFSDRACELSFHDILLVTRGRGTFTCDDRTHRVAPGTVLFTAPGEVRRLRTTGLDGACLFFTADFLREAFADPLFLERFTFLRRDRPSAALRLRPAQRRAFRRRFRAMQAEVRALRHDVSDALRAQLYGMLVTLERWYAARHGGTAPVVRPSHVVERFRELVARDLAVRRRVADYARALEVSTGHLRALSRRHLGVSAGAYVRGCLRVEAQRLLLDTDLTAAEVGHRLGFDDPAYFARFFRREAGQAPGRYRATKRGATRERAGGPAPSAGRPGPRGSRAARGPAPRARRSG